jgi:hypothetical protein
MTKMSVWFRNEYVGAVECEETTTEQYLQNRLQTMGYRFRQWQEWMLMIPSFKTDPSITNLIIITLPTNDDHFSAVLRMTDEVLRGAFSCFAEVCTTIEEKTMIGCNNLEIFAQHIVRYRTNKIVSIKVSDVYITVDDLDQMVSTM